jgi:hypothetical protein
MPKPPKALSLYLFDLRIRSGCRNISDYYERVKPQISETYYRALEGGDKTPTVEIVDGLADQLPNADRYMMFQYYLLDILPKEVFTKLISPVVADVPAGTPKAALDKKDELLASYRTSFSKGSNAFDLLEDAYVASDAMVDFLDENLELLPLVHMIYLRDGDVQEAELVAVCKKNGINRRTRTIVEEFERHKIVRTRTDRRNRYIVHRLNRTFRLPPSDKGRLLRAKWIAAETAKSLRGSQDRDRIRCDKTVSFANINQYDQVRLLRQVQDRLTDAVAELHAASVPTDAPGSSPFFVSIIISPRPEYTSADGSGDVGQEVAKTASKA